MNLKTAFQTAKYAKYAKGEGVEQESVFIQLVNRAFSPTHSVLAYFAYFAVPTSFSGMNNGWIWLDSPIHVKTHSRFFRNRNRAISSALAGAGPCRWNVAGFELGASGGGPCG
ncbi:MAG: hypothetical protein AAB676_18900 [Verrucomicrobiota bacterium]